ncbi:uncharacterized protein tacc2 isoform X3 [Salvelinus alpinus]|uniref:uncharacterized protein tacc2 isoform X3 n=1 Tax=Salvelinus alpinus TaxID=8036 RepID=UPI0039FC4870
MPETQTESKPETHTESKPETPTGTRIETKTESQTETETQSKPESNPESQTHTQLNPASQTETQTQSTPVSQTPTQSKPESNPESQTHTQLKPESQTQRKPESQTQSKPESESETQSKPESQTQSKPESETQSKPESQTETQTQSTPESQTQTQSKPKSIPESHTHTQLIPESQTQRKPESQTQSKPESESETQSKPESQTQSQTQSKPETETQSDIQTGTNREPQGKSSGYQEQLSPKGQTSSSPSSTGCGDHLTTSLALGSPALSLALTQVQPSSSPPATVQAGSPALSLALTQAQPSSSPPDTVQASSPALSLALTQAQPSSSPPATVQAGSPAPSLAPTLPKEPQQSADHRQTDGPFSLTRGVKTPDRNHNATGRVNDNDRNTSVQTTVIDLRSNVSSISARVSDQKSDRTTQDEHVFSVKCPENTHTLDQRNTHSLDQRNTQPLDQRNTQPLDQRNTHTLDQRNTHTLDQTNTHPLDQRNTHSQIQNRACIGEKAREEEEVERKKSALEEPSVVATAAAGNALPMTTPTMPEMIECEGEGKNRQLDWLERDTAVTAETESVALGDRGRGLEGIEESQLKCSAGEKRHREIALLHSACRPAHVSFIDTGIKGSPALPVKDTKTETKAVSASDQDCSNNAVPHNSPESEETGGGTPGSGTPGTNTLSPATEREKQREKESGHRTEDHNVTDTSPFPLWVITGRHCQEDNNTATATGLERGGKEGEEGKRGGGGRGKEGGEQRGGRGGVAAAREQVSLSHPTAAGPTASTVSSAGSKTYQPPEATTAAVPVDSLLQPPDSTTAAVPVDSLLPSQCCWGAELIIASSASSTSSTSASSSSIIISADQVCLSLFPPIQQQGNRDSACSSLHSQLSTSGKQEQGSLSVSQPFRQTENRDLALLSSLLPPFHSAEHEETRDSNNTKRGTETKESGDDKLCLEQSLKSEENRGTETEESSHFKHSLSPELEEKGGRVPTGPVLGLKDHSVPQSQGSRSNTKGGTETEDRVCLKQSQERKEDPEEKGGTLRPVPGEIREAFLSDTETGRETGKDPPPAFSFISPQPPLVFQLQQRSATVVSYDQPVRIDHTGTESEATLLRSVQPQSQGFGSGVVEGPTMAGVKVFQLALMGNVGDNRKLFFNNAVKADDSSSIGLNDISFSQPATGLDCASLPPLKVHENLHHPVTEASFTSHDFLSSKKPEIPPPPPPPAVSPPQAALAGDALPTLNPLNLHGEPRQKSQPGRDVKDSGKVTETEKGSEEGEKEGGEKEGENKSGQDREKVESCLLARTGLPETARRDSGALVVEDNSKRRQDSAPISTLSAADPDPVPDLEQVDFKLPPPPPSSSSLTPSPSQKHLTTTSSESVFQFFFEDAFTSAGPVCSAQCLCAVPSVGSLSIQPDGGSRSNPSGDVTLTNTTAVVVTTTLQTKTDEEQPTIQADQPTSQLDQSDQSIHRDLLVTDHTETRERPSQTPQCSRDPPSVAYAMAGDRLEAGARDRIEAGAGAEVMLEAGLRIPKMNVPNQSPSDPMKGREGPQSTDFPSLDLAKAKDEATTVDGAEAEVKTVTVAGAEAEDEATTVDGAEAEVKTVTVAGAEAEDEATTVDGAEAEDEAEVKTVTVDGAEAEDEAEVKTVTEASIPKVTVFDLSSPILRDQSDSIGPIVILKHPGPMLSHYDIITLPDHVTGEITPLPDHVIQEVTQAACAILDSEYRDYLRHREEEEAHETCSSGHKGSLAEKVKEEVSEKLPEKIPISKSPSQPQTTTVSTAGSDNTLPEPKVEEPLRLHLFSSAASINDEVISVGSSIKDDIIHVSPPLSGEQPISSQPLNVNTEDKQGDKMKQKKKRTAEKKEERRQNDEKETEEKETEERETEMKETEEKETEMKETEETETEEKEIWRKETEEKETDEEHKKGDENLSQEGKRQEEKQTVDKQQEIEDDKQKGKWNQTSTQQQTNRTDKKAGEQIKKTGYQHLEQEQTQTLTESQIVALHEERDEKSEITDIGANMPSHNRFFLDWHGGDVQGDNTGSAQIVNAVEQTGRRSVRTGKGEDKASSDPSLVPSGSSKDGFCSSGDSSYLSSPSVLEQSLYPTLPVPATVKTLEPCEETRDPFVPDSTENAALNQSDSVIRLNRFARQQEQEQQQERPGSSTASEDLSCGRLVRRDGGGEPDNNKRTESLTASTLLPGVTQGAERTLGGQGENGKSGDCNYDVIDGERGPDTMEGVGNITSTVRNYGVSIPFHSFELSREGVNMPSHSHNRFFLDWASGDTVRDSNTGTVVKVPDGREKRTDETQNTGPGVVDVRSGSDRSELKSKGLSVKDKENVEDKSQRTGVITPTRQDQRSNTENTAAPVGTDSHRDETTRLESPASSSSSSSQGRVSTEGHGVHKEEVISHHQTKVTVPVKLTPDQVTDTPVIVADTHPVQVKASVQDAEYKTVEPCSAYDAVKNRNVRGTRESPGLNVDPDPHVVQKASSTTISTTTTESPTVVQLADSEREAAAEDIEALNRKREKRMKALAKRMEERKLKQEKKKEEKQRLLTDGDAVPQETTEQTGPATEQTGPATEQTGPATDQTGPATEKTGPATEQTGPATEQTGPATEQTGPATEQTGPATEQTGPATEQTGPATEQTGPATEQTGPATEQTEISVTGPTTEQTEMSVTGPATEQAEPEVDWLAALRSHAASLSQSHQQNTAESSEKTTDPRSYQPLEPLVSPVAEFQTPSKETPTPLGPAETPTLLGPAETPTLLGPAETPTLLGPAETPTPLGPAETPTSLGQAETPTSLGQAETPTLLGPAETPTLLGPAETPTLLGPAETPTLLGPAETPTLLGPAETPTLLGPAETPTPLGPAETPTLLGPTETTTLLGPAETPTPLGPAETPTLLGPAETPTPLGPAETPTLLGQAETPTPLGPAETPTPLGPAETPTPLGPTETPTLLGPAETPTLLGPAETPTLLGPAETPTPLGPAETPTSLGQAETPTLLGQAETPTPLGPAETPTPLGPAETPTLLGPTETPTLLGPAETPTPLGQAETPTLLGQAETPTSLGQAETPTLLGQGETPTSLCQAETPTPLDQAETPTLLGQAETPTLLGQAETRTSPGQAETPTQLDQAETPTSLGQAEESTPVRQKEEQAEEQPAQEKETPGQTTTLRQGRGSSLTEAEQTEERSKAPSFTSSPPPPPVTSSPPPPPVTSSPPPPPVTSSPPPPPVTSSPPPPPVTSSPPPPTSPGQVFQYPPALPTYLQEDFPTPPPTPQERPPPELQLTEPDRPLPASPQAPAEAQASSPPAAQASSPPAAQASSPPAAQASSPPAAQASSPPAAQASSPPAAQASSPPAAQASSPPAAQASSPPAALAAAPAVPPLPVPPPSESRDTTFSEPPTEVSAEPPVFLPQPPPREEDTISTPAPCDPCDPTPRSSDSDGAFETPESTTPVKSPTGETDHHTQLLTSEDTGLGCDSEADGEPGSEAKGHHGSSLSIVFDEDKPIAASGAYNLDQLIAAAAAAAEAQSRSTLTRSLSLQAGELDGSGPLDSVGSSLSIGDSRPLAEAFSIDGGTESAPGTLRRPSKKGPLRPAGSLKKKPLLRQSSNPESPQPPSSGVTPELKKSSRAASPLLGPEDQEVGGATTDSGPASATPSPGGTLRRTRKPRVESPAPLIEETNHTSPETDNQPIPTPTPVPTQAISIPLRQEDTPIPVPEAPLPASEGSSPIPPSGAYKWDPDNFEDIDPFNTGGSKVANSPPLGRKGVANSPPLGRKGVTASIAHKTVTPVSSPPPVSTEEPARPSTSPPIRTSGAVRLEFDYSEETLEEPPKASPPPKKLGRKPGSKMPLRKPRMGLKKAVQPPSEPLDNTPATVPGDDIPIHKASYNFDPAQWDDPNFNPFGSNSEIPVSPKLNKPSNRFDSDTFDESAAFKSSSNSMAASPPTAASGSASFEVSANDNEVDNDNDNVGELEDHNQNKPSKTKKKPIKSNTFRVKRSPKRSAMSDPSSQDDHATDEEKLASSSNHKEKLASSANHKWASMEAELTSDPQEDFPQPSDLTAFVNENNRVPDYEIEYMEKIGPPSPTLFVKKPSSLYLKLDSVTDSLTKPNHASELNSPCTGYNTLGSFEEIEAQITAQMKTPVLGSRPGPEGSRPGLEGSTGEKEKTRKRESQSLSRTQSTDIEHGAKPSQGSMEVQGPAPGPSPDAPFLARLSECPDPLSYLEAVETDLAETNPTAFALKLQEELVLAALRIEALQVAKYISDSPSLSTVTPQQRDREVTSSVMSSTLDRDSADIKSSLYTRTAGYGEEESPYPPKDMEHSLGIAREEIVSKEKEVLEWQRKYEDSRQEVLEMRRIVAEYEKTIAQMIDDEQKDKSLSHHTIQQLIIEKDQALSDLNSVEKSLAELFRRYEKLKDVLEGYRKNEEVLKKCAQEYLSRVRKEEQRYQALKIHAEEKLDKANADIAQVRMKSRQETAAYQASLRKETMKVDSLERTLEQKNKEIEELTKICDELIAKMGKS